MTANLITNLLSADEPLDVLFRVLTEDYWSLERFQQHQRDGNLEACLRATEEQVSHFEQDLYAIYFDVYDRLEADHPRKHRVTELLEKGSFTLVVFDGLSLRELPVVQQVFTDCGMEAQVDYALAPVPSETSVFCSQHFGANGPSQLESHLQPFAFRYMKQESWPPDFAPSDKRRVVWALYPDNVFKLDSGAVNYERHIVQPVATILRTVLESDPPLPLVVTSDHGYLWQGGGCAWPVTDSKEKKLLADHFKGGRSTTEATSQLIHTRKAWLSGQTAVARGRFAWGGKVKGARKPFPRNPSTPCTSGGRGGCRACLGPSC